MACVTALLELARAILALKALHVIAKSVKVNASTALLTAPLEFVPATMDSGVQTVTRSRVLMTARVMARVAKTVFARVMPRGLELLTVRVTLLSVFVKMESPIILALTALVFAVQTSPELFARILTARMTVLAMELATLQLARALVMQTGSALLIAPLPLQFYFRARSAILAI